MITLANIMFDAVFWSKRAEFSNEPFSGNDFDLFCIEFTDIKMFQRKELMIISLCSINGSWSQ